MLHKGATGLSIAKIGFARNLKNICENRIQSKKKTSSKGISNNIYS